MKKREKTVERSYLRGNHFFSFSVFRLSVVQIEETMRNEWRSTGVVADKIAAITVRIDD